MIHRRVLFLDIDGVLNSIDYMRRRELAGDAMIAMHATQDDPGQAIDPDAVQLLNEIVERTDARICVSSSWRKLYTIPVLQHILRQRGLRARLIGRTPDIWRLPEIQIAHGHRCRGHEIQYWLDRHKRYAIEQFAIVDDSSDMAHLKHRFVQTTIDRGLEREHVEQLVALLKGEARCG